nr:ribonuclease H-like domain-containing protein [Tanacetum cinerariifolium]
MSGGDVGGCWVCETGLVGKGEVGSVVEWFSGYDCWVMGNEVDCSRVGCRTWVLLCWFKKLIRGWRKGCHGLIWKLCLIKGDVSRENYFVGFKVKATVTMMVGEKAKKDTRCGTWCKLVRYFVVNCGGKEKVEKDVVVYVAPFGPMFLGWMLCSRHVRSKPGVGRTWTWYGPADGPGYLPLNHSTTEPTSPLPTSPVSQTQQPPTSPPDIPSPIEPQPTRTHTMVPMSQSGIVKPIERLSLHTSSLSPIPKSPFIALKGPNWCNAMYDEYNALVKNGTWILVPMPSNVNSVQSMWLFKHKFHADGTLSRYKARLVANGNNQQLGVDFDETFSRVVKSATIHTVLSLVVSRQWPIHQLDVKNTFLNSDLSETLYMHQPLGFVDSLS